MEFFRSRATRVLGHFRNREDGAVSVEFVLWVPVFLGMVLLTADASMMFMHQSNFWNVTRDTARIVSRHALGPDEAETYARSKAEFGGYAPNVSVEVNEMDATVTVTIVGDSSELAPFGMLSFAMGDTIATRVTQSMEPI